MEDADRYPDKTRASAPVEVWEIYGPEMMNSSKAIFHWSFLMALLRDKALKVANA